ncbi:MAG: glycosyltransferase family 4 protein [Aeromicrobium sp.]
MTLPPPLRPLELAVRRRAHLVPDPVRNRLRARLAFREPLLAGQLAAWDQPLVASGTGHTPPAPAGPAGNPPDDAPHAEHPAPRGPDVISCALVTGPMTYGGLAGVVADLARGLAGHGVDVHVAAVGDAEAPPVGRAAAELISAGIGVSHLARSEFGTWLTAVSPDVMSSHGAPDWALRTARTLDVPVVDTLHGGHSFFGQERIRAARRAALSSTVVAVSDMVRTQFLAACPAMPADAVVTIPNGTRFPGFDPLARATTRRAWGIDREFVFVSLARFSVQKNAFGLVAAFRELDQERYPSHLVLAGDVDDPGYVAQVIRLRDRAPHPERIHLRQSGPPTRLLAGADCFVLNSFFEGWALASMEALAAGLPTISSEVAGAREQLTAAQPVGHLIGNPLGDPLAANWQSTARHKFGRQVNREQLTQAMQDVFEKREEWARERSRIAEESLRRFAMDSVYRRHAHVLAATAAGAPATSPRT